jgi:hypothetical protein
MTSRAVNYKITLSIFIGISIVFSVSHHTLNFWGLKLWQEALILSISIPILSLLFFLLVNRVWDLCATIEGKRWLFFLFPAVVIAMIMTGRSFVVPSTWHQIEIIPAPGHSSGQVVLYEIETPRGKAVRFSKTESFEGWKFENNVLKTVSANPAPISFSFFSPIDETISLLFLRSLDSRNVTVVLDGQRLEVKLYSQDAGQNPVQMTTAYKQGIPGGFVLFFVALMDFIAFFFLILFLWLVQEISQITSSAKQNRKDGFIFQHRVGILILLAFAVLFHAVNFLTAPLIVSSDSPGYLSGAVSWMQHHNLNGVPSSRGPGTTFLFIPAFLFFGRNPLGVKATLHLLSIACVPLSYWLGWQLFNRRSFAFFSGLITLLIPELYLYSNIVMSDVPNVFFGFLFCSLLISALETFSWKSIVACMLTASFAAFIRPENILMLVIGAGFLVIKFVFERKDVLKHLQVLGAASLIAIIPLLGWSVHNYKMHGFFGLSNYADEVLYDGWIYFGEASGFQITDPDSPAVRSIGEVVKAYGVPAASIVAPTGWELYPLLLKYGYTEKQTMKLLGDAARDSIRKDPELSMRLYILKLEKSFIPESIMLITFEIPKEGTTLKPWKGEYFDGENPLFPALIPIQRQVYDSLDGFNRYLYYPLIMFCLGVLFLSIYQKKFFLWMPVIIITASRVFVTINK